MEPMNTLETLQAALSDRYRFEREIGAGGMATVYLARDLRHDREVAVKVLKPELGAVLGADRFLSEIKVTANLHHPNLLPLFDSGEANGLLYYVMPFVKGETLRARLDRELQLPVEEAVRIAVAVASALGYAHEHGIIHRDLKPENILIQAGQPIIADFGIALAVANAGGARVTQTGLSLGTPQYMSPEQASGDRVIDARSDIYSLGAVVYEMLAGEAPHSGTNAQAIIAKLMTSEPRPLLELRATVPLHVAAVVEKSLAKLPADRFVSAHDFAAALQNPSFTIPTMSRVGPRRTRADTLRDRAMIPLAAAAALLLAAALWGWLRPTPPSQVTRYMLTFDSTDAPTGLFSRITMSPDGSTFVHAGGPRQLLYVRRRNELQASPLPGTEGAVAPFFSPSGEQVGFSTLNNMLKVVSLKGGPPITINDSVVGRTGGAWGADGYIYIPSRAGRQLVRILPSPKSKEDDVTVLDTAAGEVAHRFPDLLPNGKGLIFTVFYGAKGRTGTAIAVGDLASRKHTILVPGIHARYSVSGHLVYVTENATLMAVPFDGASTKVIGEPFAIAEGLRRAGLGTGDVEISRAGTLMYSVGGSAEVSELVWVARDGKATPVDSSWRISFAFPTLSPDGRRLAITVFAGLESDIWVKQLDKGPSQKLTFEGMNSQYPTWTPDGKSVTYFSNVRNGGIEYDLWTKRADGSGQAALQLTFTKSLAEALWSRDGKWLIFRTNGGTAGLGDIYAIRPGIDSNPVPIAVTRFQELSPTLSPDGRWLAYSSNETGQHEIFVVPFPNAGSAKSPVSTHGGSEPRWSNGGGELFFRDGAGNMVTVDVKTSPTFSFGPVRTLFPASVYAATLGRRQYDVSPDDRRFVMVRQLDSRAASKVVVVDNWFEELKQKSKK